MIGKQTFPLPSTLTIQYDLFKIKLSLCLSRYPIIRSEENDGENSIKKNVV